MEHDKKYEEIILPFLKKTSLESLIKQKLALFLEKLGAENISNFYTVATQQLEKPLFKLLLEKTGHNKKLVAKILGINRNTLHTKMKALGMEKIK